jgi:hypothetical protein
VCLEGREDQEDQEAPPGLERQEIPFVQELVLLFLLDPTRLLALLLLAYMISTGGRLDNFWSQVPEKVYQV